jgi:hypothetical protein
MKIRPSATYRYAISICALLLAAGLYGQAAASPTMTAGQIVAQMQIHNKARVAELQHYHSVRHYSVEYRGFSVHIAGQMDVAVDYDPATGERFAVISQSGSRMLVDRVLKRLVDSEKDAQEHHSAELSPANYSFQLAGTDTVDGRPAYVLEVEPLTNNKYLYRGKIWIDCAEFALMRIEAEPAKSVSFWISGTDIHHEFERVDGFWLPATNRSETRVRVGGRAVLNIDYGKYEIVPAAESLPATGR